MLRPLPYTDYSMKLWTMLTKPQVHLCKQIARRLLCVSYSFSFIAGPTSRLRAFKKKNCSVAELVIGCKTTEANMATEEKMKVKKIMHLYVLFAILLVLSKKT
jgi:hypothetical protein